MSLEKIQGIGYAPHILVQKDYPGYVVAGIEKPPKNVIDEIIVFKEGKQFLMNRTQNRIFSSDMLRNLLVLSVPFDTAPYGLLGPHEWGRSIPLLSGEIPYAGIMGTTVTAKGLFMTGNRLFRDMNFGEPTGVFGIRDAQAEIEISHALLEHEFRSALPIGYIVFNRTNLYKFLSEKWKDKKDSHKILESVFRITQQETLVCLFRITSQIGRFETYPPRTPQIISETLHKRRAEIASMASLLLRELEEGYWLNANNIQVSCDAENALINAASAYPLSEFDIKTIESVLKKTVTVNSEKLLHFLTSNSHYSHMNFLIKLGRGHDLNLNIVHQDYEAINTYTKSDPAHVVKLYENDLFTMIKYLRIELLDNHTSTGKKPITAHPDFALE